MTDDRERTGEPDWLRWTREIQAIAQVGLTFSESGYDRERYERLRELASQMMARETGLEATAIQAMFAGQKGYATPKIDVRGAVFDAQRRLLMVRERSDGDRWTLPGGWADVHLSPAENVVKEVHEESGYDVRVVKLAAAWDRSRQAHPSCFFAACKMFFICELTGGAARETLETSGVGWFAEGEVPVDLSLERTLPKQVARMFDHARDLGMPTDFD